MKQTEPIVFDAQTEKEIQKAMTLFTPKQVELLNQVRKDITDSAHLINPDDPDISPHDVLKWATCTAILELPEYQMNIYLMRLYMSSNQVMAEQLRVARQTLTNLLSMIRRKIQERAKTLTLNYL